MIDLDKYYDEYEYLYDKELVKKKVKMKDSDNSPRKKKVKKFNHNSKQDLWDEYLEKSEEDFGKEIMKEIKKEEKKFPTRDNPVRKEEPKKISDGINSHTIKGVQINFDTVISIARVENMYNGNQTFGIKFIFKSKDNGAFRIIWFGQNQFERDKIFAQETKFWASLKMKK